MDPLPKQLFLHSYGCEDDENSENLNDTGTSRDFEMMEDYHSQDTAKLSLSSVADFYSEITGTFTDTCARTDSGIGTYETVSDDGEFTPEHSFDAQDPLSCSRISVHSLETTSLSYMEAGLLIQGLSHSTQSTPSRRLARQSQVGSDIGISTTINRSMLKETGYGSSIDLLPEHGEYSAADSSSKLLQPTTTSSSMPARKRKRVYWSLWILRSFILLADVVLLFSASDGSAASRTPPLVPKMYQTPKPPPVPMHHLYAHRNNNMSHARSLEAPEFRGPVTRYVMQQSSRTNSHGGLVYVIFIAGGCIEVLFKQVFIKRWDRQRNL